MEQQLMVSGVSGDHLEEHQIYSSKKELCTEEVVRDDSQKKVLVQDNKTHD